LIDAGHFEQALNDYVENTSDSMKDAFDKALRQQVHQKHDGFRLILEVLSECEDDDGMTRGEFLKGIRLRSRNYVSASLTAHLDQLQQEARGAVIRFDSSSGKFVFDNPFYRVYALIRFAKHRPLVDDMNQEISMVAKLTLEMWGKHKGDVLY